MTGNVNKNISDSCGQIKTLLKLNCKGPVLSSVKMEIADLKKRISLSNVNEYVEDISSKYKQNKYPYHACRIYIYLLKMINGQESYCQEVVDVLIYKGAVKVFGQDIVDLVSMIKRSDQGGSGIQETANQGSIEQPNPVQESKIKREERNPQRDKIAVSKTNVDSSFVQFNEDEMGVISVISSFSSFVGSKESAVQKIKRKIDDQGPRVSTKKNKSKEQDSSIVVPSRTEEDQVSHVQSSRDSSLSLTGTGSILPPILIQNTNSLFNIDKTDDLIENKPDEKVNLNINFDEWFSAINKFEGYSWYNDTILSVLMGAYCNQVQSGFFSRCVSVNKNWIKEGLSRQVDIPYLEKLDEMSEDLPRVVAFPLFINRNHFTMVFLFKVGEKYELLYADPLGIKNDADVDKFKEFFTISFPKLTRKYIDWSEFSKERNLINDGKSFQTDGSNCGPWVIYLFSIAKDFILEKKNSELDKFKIYLKEKIASVKNIKEIREQQKELYLANPPSAPENVLQQESKSNNKSAEQVDNQEGKLEEDQEKIKAPLFYDNFEIGEFSDLEIDFDGLTAPESKFTGSTAEITNNDQENDSGIALELTQEFEEYEKNVTVASGIVFSAQTAEAKVSNHILKKTKNIHDDLFNGSDADYHRIGFEFSSKNNLNARKSVIEKEISDKFLHAKVIIDSNISRKSFFIFLVFRKFFDDSKKTNFSDTDPLLSNTRKCLKDYLGVNNFKLIDCTTNVELSKLINIDSYRNFKKSYRGYKRRTNKRRDGSIHNFFSKNNVELKIRVKKSLRYNSLLNALRKNTVDSLDPDFRNKMNSYLESNTDGFIKGFFKNASDSEFAILINRPSVDDFSYVYEVIYDRVKKRNHKSNKKNTRIQNKSVTNNNMGEKGMDFPEPPDSEDEIESSITKIRRSCIPINDSEFPPLSGNTNSLFFTDEKNGPSQHKPDGIVNLDMNLD